jgi:hypothetical protein
MDETSHDVTIQCVITPAAGKRLIARGILRHPAVACAMRSRTIVVIAGTTNGYVAEELLSVLGQQEGFKRDRFFRGITTPPGIAVTSSGRLADESRFPGDVVIEKGKWLPGKTIFDVADTLKEGDVILKGANCINLETRKAGILIGHPKGGTIALALQAVTGRRVRLLLPAGLEKRVSGTIDDIARVLNVPGSSGPRLFPVPGEVFTELEAVTHLSGAHAMLSAAGGVCGAEGAVWLSITGKEDQVAEARKILDGVRQEPLFTL